MALLRAALAPAPGEPPSRLAPTIERLIEQVSIRGGRIEEITPSGIVAAFGPEGIEDGPRRAVQAALAMRRAVPPPSAAEGHAPVSVGIHVAPCLVALGGDPMGMAPADRTAAWTALEALTERAGPQGIALSEAAARLVERRFKLRRVEDEVGAGGAAYHVVRPESTRPEKHAPGLEPVRRTRLESYRSCRGSSSGPPPGRVRWSAWWASRASASRACCTSCGRRSEAPGPSGCKVTACPTAAPRHTFRSWTFSGSAAGSRTRNRLAPFWRGSAPFWKRPEPAPPRACRTSPRSWVSTPALGWPDGVSAETLKVRTFEVLERLLAETGRDRVVVIAVEDVHWRDPTSEEFFTMLAESLAARRVLFVATYRPGSHPPWLDRSYATQVALPPLDREASVALARAALGAGRSDETLVSAIVGRAEGNPFFLEELAVAARRDALSAADAVPATVEAVLRARVDRLRPRERAVLQALAAIGRQAPASLIAAATALEEDAVLAAFRNLHAAELLVQERPGREAPRRLRHALTRDVAYLSLPPDECRSSMGGSSPPSKPFMRGGSRPRSSVSPTTRRGPRCGTRPWSYCWAAGRQSASRSAHREAVTWLERALGALAHLSCGSRRP